MPIASTLHHYELYFILLLHTLHNFITYFTQRVIAKGLILIISI
jgi:hypothetical protein